MGNTNATTTGEMPQTRDGYDEDAPANINQKAQNQQTHYRTDRKPTSTTFATYDDAASMSTHNTEFTTSNLIPRGQSLDGAVGGGGGGRSHQERGELLQKIKRQQAQLKSSESYKGNVAIMYTNADSHKSSDAGNVYPPPPTLPYDQQSRGVTMGGTRTNRARTTSFQKGPLENNDWKDNWDNDCDSSDDEEGDSCQADNNISRSLPLGYDTSSVTNLTKQVDDALRFGQGQKGDAVDWETSSRSGEITYDKPDIDMFSQLRVLGKGSFGKVVLVQKQVGNEKGGLFAMKMLRKTHLLKRGQIERTRTERKVLSVVDHPFIMKLHFAFQTEDRLFLVLDYCAGGELFFHLSRHRKFPENYTRFYTAELLLALKYLHSKGIIYRDLKPENVLFDADGHVKLGDFGLAKANISHYYKGTRSRVGTPEYMSPEVLQKWGHGFCVDYWGLGMLTFEMMTGLPPWYTTNRHELLKRLTRAPLQIPSYFSSSARNFVASLLERNPKGRLGVRGAHSVITHDFFRRLDFKALEERRIQAPILPCQGWKSPQPHKSNARKGITRGLFQKSQNTTAPHASTTFQIQGLHSEELDAATANFDKQFTRMALDSQTSHDYSDEYSDEDYGSQELNENTFIGFTFDDPSDADDLR